jgi:TIGR02453 family protein
MLFHGWTDAVLDFYEGLEVDNSRAYWQSHKKVYDEEVRGPMEALLAELCDEFGDAKMFRPHRDIRFSADKTPYKTQLGATLAGHGYVQISAGGLAAASGTYVFATDQLARYRRAVALDLTGEALVRIVDDARAAGLTITAAGTLTTAPRGYPKDHPRIELLRMKGLVTWKEWPVEPWLATAEAKDKVAAVLRASVPLVDWLDVHVGASELGRAYRD